MILVSIISLGIIIRLFFIRFNKKLWAYFADGPYGDASTYLFLIQFFRKYKCGEPDKRCLITQKPVLVPSLYLKTVASLFSDRLLFAYSWLPNFLLYSVVSSFFILFLFWYFGSVNIYFIYVVLIFITLPDNLSLDKHRIQFAVLQPRFLGMVANSAFWFIYCFYGLENIGFFIMIFFAFISLNTSIFSRQSIIFLCLICSILSFNSILILILFIASFFSIIFYPKEFIPSLLPQIQYSYQYYLNYYKPKLSGNRIINFAKNLISRPVLDSYPYIMFFITFFISIFFYINTNRQLSNDINLIAQRVLYIYISIFIVFIFTGVRKFAFLGECWRYISFNSYFITPLIFVIFINNFNIPNLLFHCFSIGFILFNILILFATKRDVLVNKNIWLTSLLENNKEHFRSTIWYGVPYRVSTLAVALGYGNSTFEYQYGNHSKEIHDEYFSSYPYLKWDETLLDNNGVTHLLVENELLKSAFNASGFDTRGLKVIDSNSHFSIFEYS